VEKMRHKENDKFKYLDKRRQIYTNCPQGCQKKRKGSGQIGKKKKRQRKRQK
jgi:hypothetical protein